ncbi:unnamed protein product, partial [Iphiclides podalirius]
MTVFVPDPRSPCERSAQERATRRVYAAARGRVVPMYAWDIRIIIAFSFVFIYYNIFLYKIFDYILKHLLDRLSRVLDVETDDN